MFEAQPHPKAVAELREAINRYESDQRGLGRRFVTAVEETESMILDWPRSGRVFPGWSDEPLVRSIRVLSFPYRVIYYVTEERLAVLAYAHEKRKPGYWKSRYTDRF